MSSLWEPPRGRWIYLPSGPGERTALEVSSVLAEGRSELQAYLVVDTPAFGRTLVLDGQVQSCEFDEWIYHESLVQPGMCAVESPRTVAVLGGGEGAMLREVLRHGSVESVVMVDIDAQVVAACREHLRPFHQGAFDDPRVRVEAAEARSWLESQERRFDVVLVDLTEPLAGGPSCKLFTKEFYELVRRRMSPGGVMALQAGPVRPNMSWAFARVVRTLEVVFDHVVPYTAWVTSFFEEWGFAVAGGAEVSRLSPELFDERLVDRGIVPRFLDGATWAGLLRLSRYIRADLEEQTEPITDAAPLALER